MTYKLLASGVQRIEDGASIPADLGNVDWQKYQAFLAAGGVPLPADVALILTPDQLGAAATDAINRFEFEIWFGQENRIRVLELKPAITRVQYRNALIAAWKTLNP